MSNLSELSSYIVRVQRRLRLGAWFRGATVVFGTALVVTVALVRILNQFAFPIHGIAVGRLIILAALASAGLFGLALPLARQTVGKAVEHLELANPELGHRLATFHDRAEKRDDPFLELLAADTLPHTQMIEPESLLSNNRLLVLGGTGIACLGVLFWMIVAGPNYLGYGASLLWTGTKRHSLPLYAISVSPGNATARRNGDQLITARVRGMRPGKAEVFAHYKSASGWDKMVMQAQPDSGVGPTFQFAFAGLPEDVEYYVAAGPLVSPHFIVHVIDLPSVRDIRVTYRYPSWSGMKPVTEEHSGDLRAIEGTNALIEFETDRPVENGQLALDGGQRIPLTGIGANKYQARISMEKDGAYHVVTDQAGQPTRISADYFIATDKAIPPEISIARPAGDYRASPIEEVTVALKASDQFGLKDVRLHYSLNGGPDRDVNLLRTLGAKSADGSHVLPLEEFTLSPGDLVSVYATAKDGHSETRTDMSFIQVDPFEREFLQSQQSGGEGRNGGGVNQVEISKREKEIISATWKQSNDKGAKDASEQGQFLSGAQQRLREQVTALSVRMQARDISETNREFTDFDREMQNASAAMAPAADKLKGMKWQDAIPLEQKALQALLRAEATFRQIQVAFGQSGGGNGGGNAGRDLASLFDLELDTAKNQYETAQAVSPAEQRTKDIDDALAKLDSLARRQQDLANQQLNPQQNFQERWEQEMLRREAEQLQRQMEQLAQDRQSGADASEIEANGQRERDEQDKSARQRSHHQSGGASDLASDPRIVEAMKRLDQATEAMKRGGNQNQNTGAARDAADQLRQSSNLLSALQQQMASARLDSLGREAARLRQAERIQSGKINELGDEQYDPNSIDLGKFMTQRRERNQLAQERQQLSDDLSNLQKNLRKAAREMANNQPDTAQKLQEALKEIDDSDLDNRVQRSADWLRRGISPNTIGAEQEIAEGLEKLSSQLGRAQAAVDQGRPSRQAGGRGDPTEALDQLQKLRKQIESMTRQEGNGLGMSDQDVRRQDTGSRQYVETGKLNRDSNSVEQAAAVANGSKSDQPGAGRQAQSNGRQSQSTSQGAGGSASGEVRYGGGASAEGNVWNNINIGNNQYGSSRQLPVPSNALGNPADTERAYQQEMRELSLLRQMVQSDPQTVKEVAELTRQMQRLDPKRFPGNPGIVEQALRELLGSVDRIELQLERKGMSPEAHTGKPLTVPTGYEESVAEYYKLLSRNP
jgi:hypothetical protein